jgi:hypothetical protein
LEDFQNAYFSNQDKITKGYEHLVKVYDLVEELRDSKY